MVGISKFNIVLYFPFYGKQVYELWKLTTLLYENRQLQKKIMRNDFMKKDNLGIMNIDRIPYFVIHSACSTDLSLPSGQQTFAFYIQKATFTSATFPIPRTRRSIRRCRRCRGNGSGLGLAKWNSPPAAGPGGLKCNQVCERRRSLGVKAPVL